MADRDAIMAFHTFLSVFSFAMLDYVKYQFCFFCCFFGDVLHCSCLYYVFYIVFVSLRG